MLASSLPRCFLRSHLDDHELSHALADTYKLATAWLQQLEISHSFAGTRLDASNRFPWNQWLRWPVLWCHALAPCLLMTEFRPVLITLTRMTPRGVHTHKCPAGQATYLFITSPDVDWLSISLGSLHGWKVQLYNARSTWRTSRLKARTDSYDRSVSITSVLGSPVLRSGVIRLPADPTFCQRTQKIRN